MDVGKLRRIESVMEMVAKDCEQEANTMDGKPFDGRTVATQLGNMLAEIQACANAVKVIAMMLADEAQSVTA